MDCFLLGSVEICRFPARIKAKTLSSVCNVPRDKANIENKLGNLKRITTFATSDRERLSNSADSNVHRALLPEAIRKGGFLFYLAGVQVDGRIGGEGLTESPALPRRTPGCLQLPPNNSATSGGEGKTPRFVPKMPLNDYDNYNRLRFHNISRTFFSGSWMSGRPFASSRS